MFGLGMPELLVILVIGLLVFGAGRLPEIGSSLGRAIKGFKESSEKREPDPPEPGEATGSGGGSADRLCPHCGKGVQGDAAFCPGCGQKLSEAA